MSCCSGTHLLIIVGCAIERGRVTSEVGEITFGVGGADTGDSVQGILIHWAHPEEVVVEQGSGGGWSTYIHPTVDTHAYVYLHIHITDDKSRYLHTCPHYCTVTPQ